MGWKIIYVKIVCIHFSKLRSCHSHFSEYIRPFLMIYLSSNYYFRALLFWNRNPFLETNSSLVLGNFFRENKHDLKRFVVYLEVDNMGKHFFFVPIGFELQTDWSDDIFCPGVSFFDTNSKTFRVIWIA